ncbi:placenta growth factor isoform X7 [Camelus ferus]|uniref:Placenta growth factor isoform X7 n=2 Tax=Camelus TaxID=9836 RepID=A0A8B8T8M0_CAMFR|nr:placenta growth factor isoform X7 [Camelus dromedarius]XP_032338273.1 placenta growth factor isoform X7 [Camelus ferus]XP_045379021.1 placenta growth factor isoform X7 [Camelus bactrianus]
MPAMRLFTCFLQLLAGLALPTVPPQQWALSAGNSSSEVEVVPFQEVWGRSYCRALERLVDIVSEYPSEVEHIFSPSCVSLLRCTGCCGDEDLHCMPVETVNVTMQASVGEDEARKVWQYCSPEVTSPSEERPHTRLVYLLPSHSQLPPCWHLPLFISQLYPC